MTIASSLHQEGLFPLWWISWFDRPFFPVIVYRMALFFWKPWKAATPKLETKLEDIKIRNTGQTAQTLWRERLVLYGWFPSILSHDPRLGMCDRSYTATSEWGHTRIVVKINTLGTLSPEFHQVGKAERDLIRWFPVVEDGNDFVQCVAMKNKMILLVLINPSMPM